MSVTRSILWALKGLSEEEAKKFLISLAEQTRYDVEFIRFMQQLDNQLQEHIQSLPIQKTAQPAEKDQ